MPAKAGFESKIFTSSFRLLSNMISVVVVNWNREALLRDCLRSLAAQTMPPIEVILVDNASSDGSVAMTQREFTQNTPFDLRLIENKANLGFCEANNQGIQVARGAFIALLNNDAEAEPGWLESLRSGFDDARVGMVAS